VRLQDTLFCQTFLGSAFDLKLKDLCSYDGTLMPTPSSLPLAEAALRSLVTGATCLFNYVWGRFRDIIALWSNADVLL